MEKLERLPADAGGVSPCASVAAPVDAPSPTPASTWGGWTPASELNAADVAACLRWAVQNIVPMEPVTILYGSASTGKTALAVHLASCHVAGEPFFGRATEGMSVLFLALENVQDVQAHVLAFQKERGSSWTWPPGPEGRLPVRGAARPRWSMRPLPPCHCPLPCRMV